VEIVVDHVFDTHPLSIMASSAAKSSLLKDISLRFSRVLPISSTLDVKGGIYVWLNNHTAPPSVQDLGGCIER